MPPILEEAPKKETLMDSRPNDDGLRASEMTNNQGVLKDEW
jgi:hypothetical protein